MSSEEKGQWIDLVAIVGTYVAYVVIVLGRSAGAPLTDVDYVPTMLGAIVVGIVLAIIGRIAVEIASGRDRHDADVRDRDIGRFGEYVAGIALGVGMIVPFLLTITRSDYFWIANAMYLAFVVAAVIGAAVKLVVYRRGL